MLLPPAIATPASWQESGVMPEPDRTSDTTPSADAADVAGAGGVSRAPDQRVGSPD